eukprot:3982890-Prymnesium_polylepis.1
MHVRQIIQKQNSQQNERESAVRRAPSGQRAWPARATTDRVRMCTALLSVSRYVPCGSRRVACGQGTGSDTATSAAA